MVVPIAQAYVGDISPKGEEGKWMGLFNSAFFTGFGFGPLMGGVLTGHFGMNAAFITMGGLNLLAFLGVTFFLPETERRKSQAGSDSSVSLKTASGSNLLRGLFIFRLAFAIGRGTFATFLPVFAGLSLGLGTSQIGLLLATYILLMSFLQVFGGRLADRFSRRKLVVLGLTINMIYLMLIPEAMGFWSLMGICALGGLGGAICMPAASALVVEEGKKFGMGVAMSIFTLALSIGMAIGPVLAGVIADMVDIHAVFYFGATMGLAGLIFFVWFTHKK
jgi:DHA1 family multidrug resistance protein-like MFS transporter